MLPCASYSIYGNFKLNRITEGHAGCTISLLFCCYSLQLSISCVCCTFVGELQASQMTHSDSLLISEITDEILRQLGVCYNAEWLLIISLLETGDIWSCESWSAWVQSTTKSAVSDFSKTNTCEQRSIIQVSDIHSTFMLLSVIIISPIRWSCT